MTAQMLRKNGNRD